MKRIWMLFLLLGSLSFAKEVSLEEAIDQALSRSRDLKISEKQEQKADLELSQAIKRALPSLSYRAGYYRSEHDRKVKVKGEDPSEDRRGSYQQSLRVDQPIFQGGSILAGIQGAKAYQNLASLQLLQAKLNSRLKTISTYSKIVNAKKDLLALEQSKKQLEERYRKQKEQLKLRLITKTDLLKTEYSLLHIDSEMEAAKSQVAIQTEELKIDMGLKREDKISVEDFVVPKDLTKGIVLEEDQKRAMKESIAALRAKYQEDLARSGEIVKRADLFPKISAFAGYGEGLERTKFARVEEEAEWKAGVELQWKLFAFGADYDAYKAAQLDREVSALEKEAAEDHIVLEVKRAYLELRRLEILRSSQERALEAAQVNFSMDQEKYDAGLISVVDYLDSEQKLRQARVQYNQTELAYYYAYEYYRTLLV